MYVTTYACIYAMHVVRVCICINYCICKHVLCRYIFMMHEMHQSESDLCSGERQYLRDEVYRIPLSA